MLLLYLLHTLFSCTLQISWFTYLYIRWKWKRFLRLKKEWFHYKSHKGLVYGSSICPFLYIILTKGPSHQLYAPVHLLKLHAFKLKKKRSQLEKKNTSKTQKADSKTQECPKPHWCRPKWTSSRQRQLIRKVPGRKRSRLYGPNRNSYVTHVCYVLGRIVLSLRPFFFFLVVCLRGWWPPARGRDQVAVYIDLAKWARVRGGGVMKG